MKSDIAVTTISWIRTPEESKIVLETILNYSLLDIPVIIADGGSSPEDKDKIRQLKNVTLLETSAGLTDQIMISHREAAKQAESLFYTHTDKLDFSKTEAPKLIEMYRQSENKGFLIPSRTKESLDTYPHYQKVVEDFLSFFIGDYIGIKEDYFAGPKLYPASLVPYLESVKHDIGWGIEGYFYAIGKRLNMPFEFMPTFIKAPQDIDDEDRTKKYRLKITKWMIKGFLQGKSVEI